MRDLVILTSNTCRIFRNFPWFKASQPSKLTNGICKGCIISKHPEHKFDRGKASRATSILGLIHSYINSTFPTTSMIGSRYVLTFIDDFSRFTWVFFLKKKSEVLERFTEFKASVENASGRKIKYLIFYNGWDYIILSFYKYVPNMGSKSNTPFPTHPSRTV